MNAEHLGTPSHGIPLNRLVTAIALLAASVGKTHDVPAGFLGHLSGSEAAFVVLVGDMEQGGPAASSAPEVGGPVVPTLGRVAREGIVAAANQAVHKHLTNSRQAGKGAEIAREFWGEAIARLKPLRVRNDRVNVFIVLKEDQAAEEGLYVTIPISSYAPGTDDRFLLFKKLSQPGDKSFGELYHCRLRSASAAPAR